MRQGILAKAHELCVLLQRMLVYVGRQSTLQGACAEDPEMNLRILGAGPLERTLSAYIDEHSLQQHAKLVGFRQNPLPHYRDADLFCLSSLYEGMPNALVEAMLCRTPVLATDCPSGPAEILDGGRYGRLVPPADARALADAIEDALSNLQAWRSAVPAA